MDTQETIRRRRSIRRYKPNDIPDDALNRLLEAMRLAPSAGNSQPWKFIVVRDEATRSKVVECCQFRTLEGKRIKQNWISEAPVIIVGCGLKKEASTGYYESGDRVIVYRWEFGDEEPPTEYESTVDVDLVIALEHLVLAATAEGIGTCWIGGPNEPLLKDALDIPDDVRAAVAVTLGYPISWPEARPRKSLDEIVCYDRYCS